MAKWIQKAHLDKGGLHRALGVPEGEKIPVDKLSSAKKSKNGHIRRMAATAETLMGLNHSRKAGDHETGSKAGGKPPRKSSTERANLRYGKKE